MSSKKIFELLSKSNEKNDNIEYDFPNLQPECVEIFSENVTDIIYETLKQKSIASGEKRKNVLEFVHNLCRTNDVHDRANSHRIFVENFKNEIIEDDIKNFVDKCSEEMTILRQDLSGRIIKFHRKKNLRQKEKIKLMETSKKFKEEVMNTKYNMQVKNDFNYYETNEDLIKNLLEESTNNKHDISKKFTLDFREKQIQMCYSLINLNCIEDVAIINSVLNKLNNYENLEKFEVNFLIFLFCLDHNFFDFTQTIINKFFFVIEKIILNCCTEILKLTEELEINDYFFNIERNKNLLKIRKKCGENQLFSCKIKSLLYTLYFHSFCNENILKFSNFLH